MVEHKSKQLNLLCTKFSHTKSSKSVNKKARR